MVQKLEPYGKGDIWGIFEAMKSTIHLFGSPLSQGQTEEMVFTTTQAVDRELSG